MKIFLSSTYIDLVPIRQSAINFLNGIKGNSITNNTGEVVAMEFFPATENTCKEECLKQLSTCNLVIGIYGEKYGSIDEETSLIALYVVTYRPMMAIQWTLFGQRYLLFVLKSRTISKIIAAMLIFR